MKLNKHLVLIRVNDVEQQDSDGIFMQEEWQTRKALGTVVAIGEEVTFVKVGDEVQFGRYGSLPDEMDKDNRLCREDEIFVNYNA